jgi:steroid 5-alpha reductase family enzyme
LPRLLTLGAQARGASYWSMPIGAAVMSTGLLLGSVADRQKSQFKLKNPDRYCDVALYRMVRCPNYLGEVIFWFGVWFSAVAAYQAILPRILSTLAACFTWRE